MTHTILCAALFAVSTSFLAARPAQDDKDKIDFPQASPAATVTQKIGLTDVSVEYSRPSARGRKIYGGLVPFGEVWRTGANTATKLTFGGDVKFEGTAVPAGSYALYTIPGEGEWTVILSKVTGQWGSYQYDEKNDLLRAKVKPTALKDPVETMCISLDNVRDDKAELAISWDKTRVAAKIETDLVAKLLPRIKAAMSGDAKNKPYFQSAMFYYEHDLDLRQAIAWMDEAVKAQPDAVWIVYRRGLIQAKAGDKKAAAVSAQQALELAKKAGGSAGAEYTRLSETLLASVK
jgi:hypothetical protein